MFKRLGALALLVMACTPFLHPVRAEAQDRFYRGDSYYYGNNDRGRFRDDRDYERRRFKEEREERKHGEREQRERERWERRAYRDRYYDRRYEYGYRPYPY